VSYNILLIEDDFMTRDMMSQRLELRGYRVVAAVDAPEGIALAHAKVPDLILMDINLPDMDGWEATRRLKAEVATRDIPVLALTAYAMASDRDKASQAGCDGYEPKPVDFPRLIAKMETLLSREGHP
jgi:CheY-like chemotaxis protein